MEMTNNLPVGFVEVMDEDEKMIMSLTAERKMSLCTMSAKNDKERATLYKAMNNPEKRLKDMINMEISVKDIYVEIVKCVNRETGEEQPAPRIVLIDDKGVGYQCVSKGILSALSKLFQVYGMPTWEKPIKLKVSQISKGTDKNILTLDPVI